MQKTLDFYRIFMEQRFYILVFNGMLWTLGLTAIALVVGMLIGIIIASVQISQFPKELKWLEKLLKRIAKIYIDIIRGTPAVVQIIFMWSVIFANSGLPRIVVGGIAFGVNSGAYMSELIRAGIQGIDKGQMEAGRSLGFKYTETMRYIIMPQAFKQMLPAFVSEFIILIKETAIISFIGGVDLMKSGNIMISRTFNVTQSLLIVAACYLLLTGVFTMIMRRVEKKINISN
ncbi:amino acid ABC transporter permease [Cellulosilyticum sp. I15G10I2]|uniref:amino acid ABC transporter permease n=1 Tax=Cellulosilyticum sp. I15G10I2 TaxID=1892843 RepID=UPI001FA6D2E2|nr:amino acid ABC transporter permease [Cellulosilyticum sp. I15G10I2]